MSIRVIWILSLPKRSVLYVKTFPLVEGRARKLSLHPVPSIQSGEDEGNLVDSILHSLGLSVSSSSIQRKEIVRNQVPAIELSFKSSTLWPVLVSEQGGLLFCCLPLINNTESKELIDHLEISLAFAFLQKLMSFCTHESQFLNLEYFFTSTAPLGRCVSGDTVDIASLKSGSSGVGGGDNDDIISVLLSERVSLEEKQEIVYGSLSLQPRLKKVKSDSISMTLNSVSLSNLDVILPSEVIKTSSTSLSVNRITPWTVHYKAKQSSFPNSTIHRLIFSDYRVNKIDGQANTYRLVLKISLNRLEGKFKVVKCLLSWRTTSQTTRVLHSECNVGNLTSSPAGGGFLWIIGSKIPKTGSSAPASLTVDILCPSGPLDISTPACLLEIEGTSIALSLMREGIQVNRVDGSSSTPVKLFLQKTLTTYDYKLFSDGWDGESFCQS